MTSALMSSQSTVGNQQKKRSAKDDATSCWDSADEIVLMMSSVTSSYSADGLRTQSQESAVASYSVQSQEIQAQRIKEEAKRSSRSDKSAAKQLTTYLSKLDVNC
ncbi:hypothetical protein F511_42471 [Dorcoceras hygrometricum]|uniref:Uncharacterized protein n=1 Tax=Dorcoceras hygrometricum TaxID=472368 RepID=A0A2Z7CC66_9LAMI|nr:hypothetical protein F511_42471 [Dorcoceras hygrometricum]